MSFADDNELLNSFVDGLIVVEELASRMCSNDDLVAVWRRHCFCDSVMSGLCVVAFGKRGLWDILFRSKRSGI